MKKNTGKPGIAHHMATVPFSDIEMMRHLHHEGVRVCDIARKFEQKPDQVRQWIDMRTRCTC